MNSNHSNCYYLKFFHKLQLTIHPILYKYATIQGWYSDKTMSLISRVNSISALIFRSTLKQADLEGVKIPYDFSNEIKFSM